LAIEHQLPSNQTPVGAESVLPKVIAEHNDAFVARPVFLRQKRSTFKGAHTQNPKETLRDQPHWNSLRLSGTYEVEAERLDRRQFIEYPIFSFQIEKVPGRNWNLLRSGLEVALPEDKNSIRISVRERAKQYTIHQTEYDRVSTDPQRKDQDRYSGEARIFVQYPDRVTKILPKRMHHPSIRMTNDE
jgi:hypothetical protein